jgi:hypothetical protein
VVKELICVPIPSLGRLLFLLLLLTLLLLLMLLLFSDFLLDDFFIIDVEVDNVAEETDNPRFLEEAGVAVVVAVVVDDEILPSPSLPPPKPPLTPEDNIRSKATSTLYPQLRNATDNSFSDICDVIPMLEMKFRSVDSFERNVLLLLELLLFVEESVIVFIICCVWMNVSNKMR